MTPFGFGRELLALCAEAELLSDGPVESACDQITAIATTLVALDPNQPDTAPRLDELLAQVLTLAHAQFARGAAIGIGTELLRQTLRPDPTRTWKHS